MDNIMSETESSVQTVEVCIALAALRLVYVDMFGGRDLMVVCSDLLPSSSLSSHIRHSDRPHSYTQIL